MDRYTVWAKKIITSQGWPLAAGGIFAPGDSPEARLASGAAGARAVPETAAEGWQAFCRGLEKLTIRRLDLYPIDYEMALLARELAGPGLLAAGLSLAIPPGIYDGPRTGGIIGAPREEIRSAEDDLEALTDDLFVCSFAGGPGFTVQGRREQAEKLALFIKAERPDGPGLLSAIHQAGIETFLIVCDGSGQGAKGYLAAGGKSLPGGVLSFSLEV